MPLVTLLPRSHRQTSRIYPFISAMFIPCSDATHTHWVYTFKAPRKWAAPPFQQRHF